jgi:hypothetical protein
MLNSGWENVPMDACEVEGLNVRLVVIALLDFGLD